jgi:outer membrane lipoprotein-sorting protein
MRIRPLITLAAMLLVSLSAFADLTVDEILAKNWEAKGGVEKLKALQAVRFSGKISLGGGMEAPFTMSKKRPENMRLDFTIQGMTATAQAYDGKTAWSLMPFLGKKDAEPMSGDMLRMVKQEADFDGLTWDYKSKGHTIELLGKSEIEGTPAYKLKVNTKEGTESLLYIDTETFLEIRTESKAKIQGQDVEQETTIGNYQEFDGYMFPTSLEIKTKGSPVGQSVTIEKVELNPTIADDVFHMPAPKKAEAPAEVKQQ